MLKSFESELLFVSISFEWLNEGFFRARSRISLAVWEIFGDCSWLFSLGLSVDWKLDTRVLSAKYPMSTSLVCKVFLNLGNWNFSGSIYDLYTQAFQTLPLIYMEIYEDLRTLVQVT